MLNMTHNKISGAINTDPEKVGGEDWDSVHVLDSGAMYIAGVANFVWSGTSVTPICCYGLAFEVGHWSTGVARIGFSYSFPNIRELVPPEGNSLRLIPQVSIIGNMPSDAAVSYIPDGFYSPPGAHLDIEFSVAEVAANPGSPITFNVLLVGYVQYLPEI